MGIKINSVGFDIDSKLEVFIEKRIQKLSKYNEEIVDTEVFLKVLNTATGENKVSEIKIDVPGGDFFAKKTSATFEEATDSVIDALKKQMQKHKEKTREK